MTSTEPDDITCGEQDEAPEDGPHCGICGRPLVRLTVRWLDADTLGDYCKQARTGFHHPAGKLIGTDDGSGREG